MWLVLSCDDRVVCDLGPERLTLPMDVEINTDHQAVLHTEFYSQIPGDTFYEVFCIETLKVCLSNILLCNGTLPLRF